jgi:hypothetical protein
MQRAAPVIAVRRSVVHLDGSCRGGGGSGDGGGESVAVWRTVVNRISQASRRVEKPLAFVTRARRAHPRVPCDGDGHARTERTNKWRELLPWYLLDACRNGNSRIIEDRRAGKAKKKRPKIGNVGRMTSAAKADCVYTVGWGRERCSAAHSTAGITVADRGRVKGRDATMKRGIDVHRVASVAYTEVWGPHIMKSVFGGNRWKRCSTWTLATCRDAASNDVSPTYERGSLTVVSSVRVVSCEKDEFRRLFEIDG